MGTPWTAIRLLSRLPAPSGPAARVEDIEASAAWAPAVGLLIGLLLAIVQVLMAELDSWIRAYCVLLAWLWITGVMHIDGAADLADALGARHRHPDRFLAALRDPHLGTFGAVAVLYIVLGKILALHALPQRALAIAILILIPAWTRFGALLWAKTVPALTDGLGKHFGAKVGTTTLVAWFVALAAASVMFAPPVLITPLLLACWGAFLKWRVRAMNGDALGAGIEWCETGALLLIAVVANWDAGESQLNQGIFGAWPDT
jgi:adenosylcobinamide-GDP ribazoletransferase